MGNVLRVHTTTIDTTNKVFAKVSHVSGWTENQHQRIIGYLIVHAARVCRISPTEFWRGLLPFVEAAEKDSAPPENTN